MRFGLSIFLLTVCLNFSCRKNDGDILEKAANRSKLMAVPEQVNNAINGYYIYFPSGYNLSNEPYPVLIFLHGRGQYGNTNEDLELLLNEGVLEVITSGRFPGSFPIDGHEKKLLVVCPQFKFYPRADDIAGLVYFLAAKYNCDSRQIHIAGMSEGGRLAMEAVAEKPGLYASLITFSGVSEGSGLKGICRSIANAHIPVWSFHNDRDEYLGIEATEKFLLVLNSMNPQVPPRFTVFPAWGLYGHDSWTKGTDPAFAENGKNIYQWMLQFHK